MRMSDKKYTEKEIREAIESLSYRSDIFHFADELLTKLNNPRHQFREGELLRHRIDELECITVNENHGMTYGNYRRQTYDELPQYVHDLFYEIVELEEQIINESAFCTEGQYAVFVALQKHFSDAIKAFDTASGREG